MVHICKGMLHYEPVLRALFEFLEFERSVPGNLRAGSGVVHSCAYCAHMHPEMWCFGSHTGMSSGFEKEQRWDDSCIQVELLEELD